MFHKITFACVILFLVGLGLFLTHFSKTTPLLEDYQRYGLVKSDIHYESVEKMWGDQGLIFYQVEFPFINVPHHADKMTFSVQEATTKLSLSNLHIDVKEGLKKIHASDMSAQLDNYIPFSDFFNKLLTSLSVLGIDEFIGDISLNTTYSDLKTMNFTLLAQQENQPTLQMSGVIHVPVMGARQFSDLWKGKVDSIDLHILNKNLLNKYLNYAQSRGANFPEDIKSGFVKLKNLTNHLPKIQDILR